MHFFSDNTGVCYQVGDRAGGVVCCGLRLLGLSFLVLVFWRSSRRLEVSRLELLLQVGTFAVALGALVAGMHKKRKRGQSNARRAEHRTGDTAQGSRG